MIGNSRPGKPSDVKVMTCMRILSVGIATDRLDEVSYMAEKKTLEYFRMFCRDVNEPYGDVRAKMVCYTGTVRKLREVCRYRISGMSGAADYMKMFSKNCPFQD